MKKDKILSFLITTVILQKKYKKTHELNRGLNYITINILFPNCIMATILPHILWTDQLQP